MTDQDSEVMMESMEMFTIVINLKISNTTGLQMIGLAFVFLLLVFFFFFFLAKLC